MAATLDEARDLQRAYHVEALQEATIGSSVRQVGDKFPAIEISTYLFYILLNTPNKSTDYARLHEGQAPTEQYVEPAPMVLGLTEDGKPITYDEIRERSLESDNPEVAKVTTETELEPSLVRKVEAEFEVAEQPAGKSAPAAEVPTRVDEKSEEDVQTDPEEVQGGTNFSNAAVRSRRAK